MFVVRNKFGKAELHVEKPILENDTWKSNSFIGYLPDDWYNDLIPCADMAEVDLVNVPEESQYIWFEGQKPSFKKGEYIGKWDPNGDCFHEYGQVVDIQKADDMFIYVVEDENGEQYPYDGELLWDAVTYNPKAK